jgi:hypothetical protein
MSPLTAHLGKFTSRVWVTMYCCFDCIPVRMALQQPLCFMNNDIFTFAQHTLQNTTVPPPSFPASWPVNHTNAI